MHLKYWEQGQGYSKCGIHVVVVVVIVLLPSCAHLFVTPVTCSTAPGLSVHHHLPKFAQVHVHCISDTLHGSLPCHSEGPCLTQWAMPCRATQDGRVTVESSEKMCSTGRGRDKSPQYTCCENLMNCIKRQKNFVHTYIRRVKELKVVKVPARFNFLWQNVGNICLKQKYKQ